MRDVGALSRVRRTAPPETAIYSRVGLGESVPAVQFDADTVKSSGLNNPDSCVRAPTV